MVFGLLGPWGGRTTLVAYRNGQTTPMGKLFKFFLEGLPLRVVEHYKKNYNLPLAGRYLYGGYTRGKQLATCERRGKSSCCELCNLPCVQ
jgi:hypothetical protein